MSDIFLPFEPRQEDPLGHMVVQRNLETLTKLFTTGVDDGDVPIWDADLGRFITGPPPEPSPVTPMVGDWKLSAQTADHADPSGVGTWYIMNATTALPSEETELIALIGANRKDHQGRMPVALGTHADVNAIGDNDGVATVANRRPKHRHSPHRHAPDGGAGNFGVDGSGPASLNAAGAGNWVPFTTQVDGGSGNANDSLDAPAFSVVGNSFYYGSGS